MSRQYKNQIYIKRIVNIVNVLLIVIDIETPPPQFINYSRLDIIISQTCLSCLAIKRSQSKTSESNLDLYQCNVGQLLLYSYFTNLLAILINTLIKSKQCSFSSICRSIMLPCPGNHSQFPT